ncbi:Gpi16 subunit, GPI transamidase component [Rhizopus microsporus ATCC 52813]|uniref:Gpi16 subunit, GPI transamidase component n=2 Tax=Rhizopus microsporus TaxID=58291 RepID=A0A2G4T4S0_RHIZD|nr:Gpi16 subunit, GPI transamidase component [Rhizopus microsporus ATCC 52813]PHZ16015.1 Gpi16 subunit, GPI transamidase component [Rhizopus microsporus ATCC 52813]
MLLLLQTWALLLCSISVIQGQLLENEQYDENLTFRHLPDGKLLAHFEFETKMNASLPLSDYGLYPKAIGQVLDSHTVSEMHLSFTQGRWNYEEWGYPPTLSSGTGVELWAWIKDNGDVDTKWKALANTLSGLFCASLNFIDETMTTEPRLSFQSSQHDQKNEQLRYGSLPHENVCTENLTPWIKLLPCKAKSGMAVLLNPHKLYNSNFHTMAIHATSICLDESCSEQRLELVQTITSVMDPVRETGRRDWSLTSIFDRQLNKACPLAKESRVVVDVANAGEGYDSRPQPYVNGTMMSYDLSQAPLDIGMTWHHERAFEYPLEPKRPVIYAQRYFTGYGQERGGLKITMYNRHKTESVPVIYYDSIPWYLKLYMHTFKVNVIGKDDHDVVKQMYYQPAIDRGRPSTLEYELLLPPDSIVTMSLDFDKVFLKYTEHRPDANRGFDIGSAVLSTWDSEQNLMRIYTDTLLVVLPTPDFSMPYNVITLTCTVIALFFGSVFNLLIRNFTPV